MKEKAKVLNSKSDFPLIRKNVDICANFDSSCKMMIFSFFHYNVIQAIFGLKVSGVVFEYLYNVHVQFLIFITELKLLSEDIMSPFKSQIFANILISI